MMLIVSFLDTLKNNVILAKKVLIYFWNFGHHLFKFRCLPSLKIGYTILIMLTNQDRCTHPLYIKYIDDFMRFFMSNSKQ